MSGRDVATVADRAERSGYRSATRAATHVRLAVVAAVVAFAALSVPASAQIEVENLEVVIGTGATGRVGLINVRNVSEAAVSLTLDVQDWDRGIDGATRYSPSGSTPGGCGSSLSVFPMSLRLEPNERQQLRVTLADSAPDRPCWSIVFISTPPTGSTDSSRVRMLFVSQTGVKVYVEPASLSRMVELDSITALPDTVLDRNTPTERGAVQAYLSSTGALQVRPRAVLQVRRPDNTIAASVQVPAFPMLPGASRRVTVPLPRLAAGPYIGLLLVDYGGPEVIAAQVAFEVPPEAP